MLFTKRARYRKAFDLVDKFVSAACLDLVDHLFVNKSSTLCAASALLVYLGTIFGTYDAPLDIYIHKFDEKPLICAYLRDSVAELVSDVQSRAGQEYHEHVFRPNMIERIANDPYNAVLDARYCGLVYALLEFIKTHSGCTIRPDIRRDDLPQLLYYYFLNMEPAAKDLHRQLLRLFN